MKQVIIDGKNFSNLEGFFNEIERLLAPNHNWRIHAFNTGHVCSLTIKEGK